MLFVILVLQIDMSTALRQRVEVAESPLNLDASATELPANLIFDFDFDASVMMQMRKDVPPGWHERTVEEAGGNDGGDDDDGDDGDDNAWCYADGHGHILMFVLLNPGNSSSLYCPPQGSPPCCHGSVSAS